MFSDALRILDENTVKYMIEELRAEIAEKENALRAKDDALRDKNNALKVKDSVIEAMDDALRVKEDVIEELQRQIAELKK